MADVTLEALLEEGRTFPPPDGFVSAALVTDGRLHDAAGADPQGFWAGQAGELLDWSAPWDTCSSGSSRSRSGSSAGSSTPRTTASIATSSPGHGDQVAFLWEGEPGRLALDHLRASCSRT